MASAASAAGSETDPWCSADEERIIISMERTWLSTAAMDPTWLGIIVAIGALGLIATVIVLIRQAAPPTRVDRERVARHREASGHFAH